jgi:rSAM-associated Gly-rich repeat protein
MLRSSRSTSLFFLLTLAALLAPAARAAGSATGGSSHAPALSTEIEARLDRITQTLRNRHGSDDSARPGDPLRIAGFVNGPRGWAVGVPRGGAFVNGRGYYGPNRSFVNGGGGYWGGFVNGPVRPSFVNW